MIQSKTLSRHSGAGRNPVLLFNMHLFFVLLRRFFSICWIPACAGMTR
jgi:hypothetical protein